MKKRPSIIGFTLLVILCSIFVPLVARLPIRPDALIQPTPPEWNGVLDIWLCQTFDPGKGSFLNWLNKYASAFEKQHAGLHLRITQIDPALAFERIGTRTDLPDAVFTGAGMFENSDLLLPTGETGNARKVFTDTLCLQGQYYGTPIAAGAYTILYNSARVQAAGGFAQPPQELLRALIQNITQNRKSIVSYAISCPQSKYISPIMGMLSMLEFSYEDCQYLSPQLCKQERSVAWADFVLEQKSAAFACTQKEVFRMRQLEAGSGAFAWQVHPSACLFTDQLLSLYAFDAPATGRSDAPQRARLAQEFALSLLSPQAQTELAGVGAFSVIALDEPLYPQGSAMAYMEQGLADEALLVPHQFSYLGLRVELGAQEAGAADTGDVIALGKKALQRIREERLVPEEETPARASDEKH